MPGAPTLSQLRLLLAIVETGSFTAAAVELNLTQSGVSHAVQQLEEALGVRLLERGGRGAQLTPAGLRVLPRARHILNELESLLAEAGQEARPSGTVRIASFPSLALHLMPEVLREARRQFPDIEVQLRDDYLERRAVEAAVLRGEADIGLTALPAHPSLLSRSLGQDPYELLLPTGWDPASVWDKPYIHLGAASDDPVVQHLRQLGVQLRPALCLLTESAIGAMVARQLGFAILPRLTLGELGAGVTRAPLPGGLSRTLGTVTRPGELSPAGRCLLKLVWDRPLPPAGPPGQFPNTHQTG